MDDADLHGLAPIRKPKPYALVAAIAATGVAVGLGAFAAGQRADAVKARKAVAQLEADKLSLTDALDLHRGKTTDLDTQLTGCKQDLSTEKAATGEVEAKRLEADTALSTCRASVKDLETEQREAAALLAEFKAVTGKFQKMIDAGKLDVVFRRGEMVLKLPDAILFPSGSDVMSEEGKKDIAEVAAILRQVPGRRFTVAGHTDNVDPGPSSKFDSNWELSAARAVRVTEALIAKGVPATRLVAAGHGEYDPLVSNGTAGGRQKNRRIEIILEPNLKPVAPPAEDKKKKK